MLKRRVMTLGLLGSATAVEARAQSAGPVGRITVVNAHHTR